MRRKVLAQRRYFTVRKERAIRSCLSFPFPVSRVHTLHHAPPSPLNLPVPTSLFYPLSRAPFPALGVCSTGSSTLPSLAHDSSVPRSQPLNLSVCILPLFFWAHSLPYPLFSLRPVPSKPVCNASLSLIPLLPPILSGRAASLLFLLHLRWFSFAGFAPFRLTDTSALTRGVQSNHTALLAQILVFIF